MLVAILLLLVYSGISAAISVEEVEDFAPDIEETKNDLDESMKASSLVDLHTMLILEQVTFPDLPGVPHLPYNQQQTKATARSWRSVVRPALFRANDAIIVFGNYFNITFEDLKSVAGSIREDAESRELLSILFDELRDDIVRQKILTADAATKLRTFFNSMTSHSAQLQLDVKMLDNSTNVGRGEVPYLKSRIETLDRNIQDYENDLKTTTYTAVTNWFFVVQTSSVELRDLSMAKRMLNNLLDERYQVYMRLAAIDSNLVVASLVNTSVVKLIDFVRNILNATESLQKTWTQLENDYVTISQRLSHMHATPRQTNVVTRSFEILFQRKLEAAHRSWIALLNYASEIKREFLVPHRLNVIERT